jgi:hypothetical protein
MKLCIKSITENPVSLMRRAGYTFQRQEQEEMSFIRPLAQSGYPRFHCYTTLSKSDLLINLHLDQKKHTYGEATRHHGEYEDEGPVSEEGERLSRFFSGTVTIL